MPRAFGAVQCSGNYYAIVLPSKKTTGLVAIRREARDLLLWVLQKQNAFATKALLVNRVLGEVLSYYPCK